MRVCVCWWWEWNMKSQKHKFGIYIDNREKLSIQTHDPRHNRLWVYVFCVSVIIIHIHLVGSKTYRQKYWMREKWLFSFIALMDELYLLWWLWWQLFDSIDMNQKNPGYYFFVWFSAFWSVFSSSKHC